MSLHPVGGFTGSSTNIGDRCNKLALPRACRELWDTMWLSFVCLFYFFFFF